MPGPSTNGGTAINGTRLNGQHTAAPGPTNGYHHHSRLQASDPDAVHDLLCVGFGPASLAVAVALHDAIDAGTLVETPKVLFLEKQSRFAWHAGMLLPGAKMQISFIKDLATLRDPRSNFTFINYLHEQGRLVEFTNLGTFLPARAEYEDYLRWCAGHFGDVVRYGSEVISVARDEISDDGSSVATFRAMSRDTESGLIHTHRAKNLLLAVGGQPLIPECFPPGHPRVIHSSQYTHLVPKLLNDSRAPYRVAVVGAGQSAAEIFNNIQALYPNSSTSLIMRSEFLKPSDDSPFVNSIFNPEYIDTLFPKSATYRQNLLAEARTTNYGVVRLELIEALYERMYDQRRELGKDEKIWPHRILGGRNVRRVEASSDYLRVFVEQVDVDSPLEEERQPVLQATSEQEDALEVDLIISATGYRRNAHLELLQDLWPLLPERADKDNSPHRSLDRWEVYPKAVDASGEIRSSTRILEVARNYKVQFPQGTVAAGSGIWLQGCCEATHGLSDTLLSVLATRSGEIVESIFGRDAVGN